MRSRAIAVLTAAGVAIAPAAFLATNASAQTNPPHAGQSCSPKKKAPKGFACKKNSKGKYVLSKSKTKSKTKTKTTK
jgi:hypothetical protein